MTTSSKSDGKPETDLQTVDYLVQQALELSELALKSGNPEASALFTIAVSHLRKKAG